MENISPDLMMGKKSFLFIEKEDSISQFIIPSLISILILPMLSVFSLIAVIFVLLIPIFPADGISPDLAAQFLAQIFGIIFLVKTQTFFFKDQGIEIENKHLDYFNISIRIFCQIFIIYFGINFLLTSFLSKFAIPENPYANWLPSGTLRDHPFLLSILILTTIVGAPFFEEYIFRRLLIPALQKRGMGNLTAIIASSLVFGLVHTPNNLLNGNYTYTISHLVSTFLMGFAAGLTFIITKKYLMAVLIHALFNIIGIISLIFSTFPLDPLLMTQIQAISLTIYSYLLVGIFIFGLVFWVQLFFKKNRKQSPIVTSLKLKQNTTNITKGFIGFIAIFLISVTAMNILEILISSSSMDDLRLILYVLFEIISLLVVLFVARHTKSESEIQQLLSQNP